MNIKRITFVDPEPTRASVVKAMATVTFDNGLTIDRLSILKYEDKDTYFIGYPNTHYQPSSWVDAYYFSDINQHKKFTKKVVSEYEKYLKRKNKKVKEDPVIEQVFDSIIRDTKKGY
jgi:DNA-binding cell septation regulator SpoVG